MGLFNRNPKPGTEIQVTHKSGGVLYGISIGYAAITERSGPDALPWDLLRQIGKVEAVPDGTIPRAKMRPLLLALGVLPPEMIVLGDGATVRELDQCWEALTTGDEETSVRIRDRVAARRAKKAERAA